VVVVEGGLVVVLAVVDEFVAVGPPQQSKPGQHPFGSEQQVNGALFGPAVLQSGNAAQLSILCKPLQVPTSIIRIIAHKEILESIVD